MPRSIHSPAAQALCDELKATRGAKGLSQRELAARLAWSPSMVAKAETGERRLDLVELAEVCDALGVSVVEFVKRWRARR